jgi:hypothetical protein
MEEHNLFSGTQIDVDIDGNDFIMHSTQLDDADATATFVRIMMDDHLENGNDFGHAPLAQMNVGYNMPPSCNDAGIYGTGDGYIEPNLCVSQTQHQDTIYAAAVGADVYKDSNSVQHSANDMHNANERSDHDEGASISNAAVIEAVLCATSYDIDKPETHPAANGDLLQPIAHAPATNSGSHSASTGEITSATHAVLESTPAAGSGDQSISTNREIHQEDSNDIYNANYPDLCFTQTQLDPATYMAMVSSPNDQEDGLGLSAIDASKQPTTTVRHLQICRILPNFPYLLIKFICFLSLSETHDINIVNL